LAGNWKYSFIPYWSNNASEVLDVLARYGYQGVEWIGHIHFTDRDKLKAIADLTRKKGLDVANIMCSSDLVVPDDSKREEHVKYTIESIKAARDAAVERVNLFSGPAEWDPEATKVGRDFPEGAAWKNLVSSMSRIVDAAEKNDITITFEAAFGMLVHDYYTLQEFLSYFPSSKSLTVNLDPSHMVLYGNDVAYAVRKLGKRIKHVHAKDAAGKPPAQNDTFIFPQLGEGVTDWKGFFDALREVGYNGYLSVEFEAENYLKNVWGGDWAKAAEASKEQLDKLTTLE
jgi:sugar phosphate isomerase/epimerase